MPIVSGISHWLAEEDGVQLNRQTLGALLARQAARFGERDAVIFDEEGEGLQVRWTYAELNSRVDQLAAALMSIGIGLQDRVAVFSPSRPEWVLLEFALARIGAVLVTVNPAFKQTELDYLLKQGRVCALFSVGSYRQHDIAGMLVEMMPDLAQSADGKRDLATHYPDLRRVVCIDADAIAGALGFTDLLKLGGSVGSDDLEKRAAAVEAGHVIQIQYTSGTTGQPKGVMLTHYGTINNAMLAAGRAGYRETDVMVSAMPLFHTAGCVCDVMGMLAAGGCVVKMESFDARRMLDLIEAYVGTVTNGVPTMYSRLLADQKFVAGKRDLSSWRIAYIGGASIPPQLMLDLKERVGPDPVIIMGMTECSPIISQTDPADPITLKVTTAGKPLPHVEVRIADPTNGKTVAQGVEGELLIRGFLVMAGYFDMPEKTAEAIDAEGWMHSGDIATMDAEGRLRIVGRIKDMLIRGGENIYPAEIEQQLIEHPDIAEVQVIGVPDPEFGEEICAVIVPVSGRTVTIEALREWCRSRMARHKLPRYVMCVEAMPQTSNGKVRKVELKACAAAMLKECVA